MLRPSLASRQWRVAAGVGAGVLLLVIAAVWRLASGPVPMGWLKPGVEHAIADKVKGGHATLDKVSLAWFPQDKSLGLRLEGLHLTDAKGRTVADARRLDAAFAVDALAGFQIAPGRIAADHFFAAVSVSPDGRYGLGYEPAAGPVRPGRPVELDRMLLELTGKSRLGRSYGFLRTVDLTDGRVALRQIGGGPAWVADVHALTFHKGEERLQANVDVAVEGGDHPARLSAAATGAVGLSHAWVRADIENLRPAALFPSVGPTAPFSALDAPVQGRGSLAYDFHSGVKTANLSVRAGQGTLNLGRGVQAFKSAEIEANYAPRTGEVVLSAFKMEAEKTRLDLTGAFRLTPEDAARKVPARLEYRISGPRFVWRLADDAPPQDLYNVTFRGRLIPEAKRLEIDQANATIAGAPFTAHGAFFRDARDRLGAQLEANVGAPVGPDQIFAFWPESFASSTRGFLHRAVLNGRFTTASFRMDALPGHLRSEGLDDEEMNLQFSFENAAFRFADEFPAITDGRGRAVLKGNSFDLALDAGRMGEVALSQGSVEMPTFRVHGADATYRFVARGGVRDILTAIDGPKLHLISGAGFDRNRASGQAAVKVVVRRPMLFQVPKQDIRIDYEGVIEQGRLANAALGWDLTDASLKLKGDQTRFVLSGKGVNGPYKGDLEFRCDFGGEGSQHTEQLALDGALDAAIMGGPEGRWSPFAGRFAIKGGDGSGNVHAAVFDGRVAWKAGDGPERFIMTGWGDAEGLRQAGTPLATGLADHFPTQVRFDRTGDIWRGPIKADLLSGSVVFAAGARPRLIYDTEITPQKARKLGLAELPLFQTARRVTIDSVWQGAEGSADVKSGGLDLQLGWGHGEHRAQARLTPQDMAALGLPPLSLGNSPVQFNATWKGAGDRISGIGQAADTVLHFQTAPAGRGGGEIMMASADVDGADLKRMGLPSEFHVEGKTSVFVHMNTSDHGAPTGRVEVDLSRADMSVEGSDWRKPAGKAGRAYIDFARAPSGEVRLTHISAQADNLDLDGSATVMDGKLTSADFGRLRLAGLFDASVRAARDLGSGEMNITVRGRQFDARRWFSRSARAQSGAAHGPGDKAPPPPGLRAPEPAPEAVRIDAAFEQVRLTDDTKVQDLRVNGVWGGPQITRLDISASTVNGGRFKGRLFPQNGFVAVSADTTDAGEVAKGLFGVKDLKGGRANITGRLVEGGADLNVEVHDVRVVHAPAMAQLLTVASFKGLADTLNGDGVLFTRVWAPVQIRGSRLTLNDARATGSALGITAQGMADIDAGKLDIRGTLAPAYSLNSAVGGVPVLGQILTSRKGEGVVGLGYQAKGSIEKPQVMVNPLSLVTPGILRRMFEGSSSLPAAAAAPHPAGGGE
jgi:hypothetical protein